MTPTARLPPERQCKARCSRLSADGSKSFDQKRRSCEPGRVLGKKGKNRCCWWGLQSTPERRILPLFAAACSKAREFPGNSPAYASVAFGADKPAACWPV